VNNIKIQQVLVDGLS